MTHPPSPDDDLSSPLHALHEDVGILPIEFDDGSRITCTALAGGKRSTDGIPDDLHLTFTYADSDARPTRTVRYVSEVAAASPGPGPTALVDRVRVELDRRVTMILATSAADSDAFSFEETRALADYLAAMQSGSAMAAALSGVLDGLVRFALDTAAKSRDAPAKPAEKTKRPAATARKPARKRR